TVFFVGTMGLSVLSATGVERVLTRTVGMRYAIGWLIVAAIIVLLGSLGILTDFAQALAPDDMVDMVIANSLEVITGAWRSFGFILLGVVVIAFYRKRKIPIAAAGWGLALLAAVDSWTIIRQYWVF